MDRDRPDHGGGAGDRGEREGWVRSDGLKLRYLQWGPDDAPALVMLHGLRSYGHTWEPVARPLADRWRCIALDQRGRGASDWDPGRHYDTDAYVRDLEALAGALGLRRFVLLGHSMGGTNAFVYAMRHPQQVRALVIEDMGPGASASSGGAERIKRELRGTPARFASREEGRAWWRRQRPNISEAALDSRVEHSLRALPDGTLVWRHDAEGIAQARLDADPARQVDLWPAVQSLAVPTLLLRGADSDFLSRDTARAMTGRNPRITLIDVPGASHYVHDDNLPAFEDALHRFLHALPA